LVFGWPAGHGVPSAAPLNLGNELQLFVDRTLIDQMENVQLRLHSPARGEVVFKFDAPWEGPMSGYVTVMEDAGLYRLYYRGGGETSQEVTAMAVSKDGLNWARPNLGLHEFDGSTQNNIIFRGRRKSYWESHNFTPFKDRNPSALPAQQYKAVALGRHVRADGEDVKALVALVSPDGMRWERLQEAAIITDGSFDSQNVAFWDTRRREYVCYLRDGRTNAAGQRVRSVKRASSRDFIHWTQPVWLDFGDAPLEHFYVNAISPYFRAPGYYLGFPMRFVPYRRTVGAEARPVDGVSDAVFIASRDGLRFERLFLEAFIRPGPDPLNWGQAHGNNTPAWGLLPTSPTEMSLYWAEHYGGVPQLRRGTLRLDGFVSVQAPHGGGRLTTKPFLFRGRRLALNYATSAVGSVRVEVLRADGSALPGLSRDDCLELYGDEIERLVAWKRGNELTPWADQPVRLRFHLQDADLFSFRFSD
jgi:hypothetical protein